jgi:hypothetical protein
MLQAKAPKDNLLEKPLKLALDLWITGTKLTVVH